MINEDELMAYLSLAWTEPVEAAIALATADRALSWIEAETGRHFREPREFVLRFDGGERAIWLPEKPIESEGDSEAPDTLVMETLTSREWTVVDPDDYELLDAVSPIGPYPVEHFTHWPAGRRNVRATFTAGYLPGELPGDVVMLVYEMTAHRYRERGDEGLRSETIGGYSYTRGDIATAEARKDWLSTLLRWKHMVFA